MLVVWEPILVMDWLSPSGSDLARITDLRARQFWDPKHLVAQALNRIRKETPGQPQPNCCVDKGFFWDEAILYPQNAKWQQAPAAVFWDGPVVRAVSEIEKALQELGK